MNFVDSILYIIIDQFNIMFTNRELIETLDKYIM